MRQVLELTEIDAGMTELVGGKAVNLGVLTTAGLPVPAGFCITTDAYRQIVGDRLDTLLVGLVQDPDQTEGLARRARDLVRNAPVPDELRDAVLAGYQRLGDDVAVAVRSSATAEDLAYASFAGQQDTYLNVVGADALLTAVRDCWASLWTDRAVAYRAANAVDQHTVSLAVVVQRLVPAAVAGVMFTANPVTGTRGETVIDASPGLGESVVSGAVNPDHFVVGGTPPVVRERRLGDKRVAVVSRAGGGTERQEVGDGSGAACLDDEQVLRLAALGRQVEQHYGAPQDTEWALDPRSDFWLTQARPITTLYPRPSPDDDPLRVFVCLSLAQGLTRPITPMGLASFRLIGSGVAAAAGRAPADRRAGPRSFRSVGQRAYVDITPVLGNAFGRRLFSAAAGVMESRAVGIVARLSADERFPLVSRSPLAVWGPILRVAGLRARVPLRMVVALVSPVAAYRAVARIERQYRRISWVPTGATAEERLRHVEDVLSTELILVMPRVFGYPVAGFAMVALARRLLRGRAAPDELQTVLRGLPHNVTTEMDLELWRLTERIGRDAEARSTLLATPVAELATSYTGRGLPPVAQRELTGFLRRYGQRAVAEIDLGMPRWSDDPSHLIGVVANYLRLDDPARAPEAQFEQGRVAAEAMAAELVSRVHGATRARLVRFALRRARQLVGLRESPKFVLVTVLGLLGAQLRLVGTEAVVRGAIEQADDVFFLDMAEAARALAGEPLQDLVAVRRADYAAELRRRRIPRLLLSDGTDLEATVSAVVRPDGALQGSPASPGTITGPARVILDPVGAHLEPGEILVAPSTDPGWTPLFLTAGGLVMEMGGANSHGAVVAREYGIPAVVGVPDATHVVRTGQLLTVDGSQGLVSAAAAAEPGPG